MSIIEQTARAKEYTRQSNIIVDIDGDTPSEAILNYLESLPLKYVDIDKIVTVLSFVIAEDPDGWPAINPDIELLEAGDESETRRVMIEISKRKFRMQTAIKDELRYETESQGLKLTFRGETITPVQDEITSILKQSKIVMSLIWEWIDQIATTEGGVLALNNENYNYSPQDYTNVEVDSSSDVEALQTIAWRVARQLLVTNRRRVRLEAEQHEVGLDRSEFEWQSNPLIAEFRVQAKDIVLEYLEPYRVIGVTEFDLVTQVMMHLAVYEATEVWLGDTTLVLEITETLRRGETAQARQLFTEAISGGSIWLNVDLARKECERHAKKLADHYQKLSVQLDGETVDLPAAYMGNPELNPFRDFERSEISAKDREYTTDSKTGEKIMVVVEKHSGKRIIFKSVPPEISYLYSVGFSNLHYPREGETAVYGAYLEGDSLPFAYSSYTPVERQYSQDMLFHLGINPTNIMESARAWNASWAPENTMSVLFAFAHEMMREQRQEQIEAGEADEPLEGVFTSINPNLGFKAVSFRGVRFNVAGIKPTGFSYLIGDDGTADFLPRAEIRKRLGVNTDEEMYQHPRYTRNTVPFLETLEMISLFDINAEKELLSRPIYRVTEEAYYNN